MEMLLLFYLLHIRIPLQYRYLTKPSYLTLPLTIKLLEKTLTTSNGYTKLHTVTDSLFYANIHDMINLTFNCMFRYKILYTNTSKVKI